jgi:pimeloyl-ACP methyl ester carboxylesterase
MADALETEAVILPGIGHLAAFEAPQAVAAALAPLFV